jgi:hypothetical protein
MTVAVRRGLLLGERGLHLGERGLGLGERGLLLGERGLGLGERGLLLGERGLGLGELDWIAVVVSNGHGPYRSTGKAFLPNVFSTGTLLGQPTFHWDVPPVPNQEC